MIYQRPERGGNTYLVVTVSRLYVTDICIVSVAVSLPGLRVIGLSRTKLVLRLSPGCLLFSLPPGLYQGLYVRAL